MTSLIFYCALFSTFTLSLSDSQQDLISTIRIEKNGFDHPSCITDQLCHTLNYTLDLLSSTQQPSRDVIISVNYNHTISSVNVTFPFDMNLTITSDNNTVGGIFCEEEGYVHILSPSDQNISLTFDGVGFFSCRGYYVKDIDRTVYGFYFSNVDTFIFRNNFIFDSGDLVVERSRFAHIHHNLFIGNIFLYSQVLLSQQVSPRGAPPNSSYYLIEDTIFTNNTGISGSAFLPSGTLSYYLIPDDSKYVFEGIVRNCVFNNNRIMLGSQIFDRNIGEISVLIPSGDTELIDIKMIDNIFENDVSSYGRTVWIGLFDPLSGAFQFDIFGNIFRNNSFNNGYLVSIYFANLFQTSVDVTFVNNTMDSNIGVVCLSVDNYGQVSPSSLYIADSSFTNNINCQAISLICPNCGHSKTHFAEIDKVVISGNIWVLDDTGLVTVSNQSLLIADSNITDNFGTGLCAKSTLLFVSGWLIFQNNTGRFGGGIALLGASTNIFVYAPTILTFYDNLALYGAAMYIGVPYNIYCIVTDPNCSLIFDLHGNIASSSGRVMFVDDPNLVEDCLEFYMQTCFNITDIQAGDRLGFGSSVSMIDFIYGDNDTNTLSIFPGQNIVVNVSMSSPFGEQCSCVATVYLRCANQVISCTNNNSEFLRLEGATQVTLSSTKFTSDLKLITSSSGKIEGYSTPTLYFQCPYSNMATLILNIKQCPLGFVYNASTGICDCAWNNQHSGYACSVVQGYACIAKGYWFGSIKVDNEEIHALTACQYTYCQPLPRNCPLGESGSTKYILLPATQDEQCANYHGGIMCASCQDGATFSFEGALCIPMEQCKPWQPYTLLVLVIVFQLLLVIVVKVLISIKFSFGLGYLYGPLFFIAVLNHLPFNYYAEFYPLKIITTLYTSIFLLNMEIFGQIPWCFFTSLTALENYAFHYLGPLIVGTLLLATVFTARRCPRVQESFNISPLQAVCVFLLLSFWSLADTSIRILDFKYFPSNIRNTYRVNIDPEIVYFTGVHIPLGLVAIAILVCVLLPFILILLFSSCLVKKVNLIRVKPLLDQFQSCCKDSYRWYPALYMIGWLLFLSVEELPFGKQTLLVCLATVHFLIQPYNKRWLNMVDTLLLADLIILIALLNEDSNPHIEYAGATWVDTSVQIVVYVLSIIPLVCIMLSWIGVILYRFKVHEFIKKHVSLYQKLKSSNSSNAINDSINTTTVTSVTTNSQDVSLERGVSQQLLLLSEVDEDRVAFREPLLSLLSEDEQQLPPYYGSQTNN